MGHQLDTWVTKGRIVDGHGDLRSEHVCLVSPPVVTDCIEFSHSLRLLDPVDELSFLGLECDRLGVPWVKSALSAVYCIITGDNPHRRLRAFYRCRNAIQRAQLVARNLNSHDTRRPPNVWIQ